MAPEPPELMKYGSTFQFAHKREVSKGGRYERIFCGDAIRREKTEMGKVAPCTNMAKSEMGKGLWS